jgi:putative transposase
MARPLRLEFVGCFYHVTSRGDGRGEIYRDDEDRGAFLTVLVEAIAQHNGVLHAYCLMSNHYHLLVETPEGNLSRGMRQLNGVYTQRFNRRHTRVGHLYQGRYQAIIVRQDSYLLARGRYIVLNPVRARMVRSAWEWAWSNYRATAGLACCPGWLAIAPTLAGFGARRSAAQERYREYVAQGKNQRSPWKQLKNQIFLGDDAFVEHSQAKIEVDGDRGEIPKAQRRALPKPLEAYAREAVSRDDAIALA